LRPTTRALDRLEADEFALVKLAAQFPRVVESAAAAREPHRVAFFLYDLAAAFHAHWNLGNDNPAKRFIVTHDPALTGARLFLVSRIGQVVKNGLAILGVEAAEEL
jgi:arginyl-tRNA synthetase